MDFITFYLFSILLSLSLKIKYILDVNKELALRNKLFDYASYNVYAKVANFRLIDKIINNIEDFIPIVNIINRVMSLLSFYNNTNYIINLLESKNLVVDMSSSEKETFSKFKSSFASLKLAQNKGKEFNKNKIIVLKDGSIIWYDIVDGIIEDKTWEDDIAIIRSTGPISNLSLTKQKEKVFIYYINIYKLILNDMSLELAKEEEENNNKNKERQDKPIIEKNIFYDNKKSLEKTNKAKVKKRVRKK